MTDNGRLWWMRFFIPCNDISDIRGVGLSNIVAEVAEINTTRENTRIRTPRTLQLSVSFLCLPALQSLTLLADLYHLIIARLLSSQDPAVETTNSQARKTTLIQRIGIFSCRQTTSPHDHTNHKIINKVLYKCNRFHSKDLQASSYRLR